MEPVLHLFPPFSPYTYHSHSQPNCEEGGVEEECDGGVCKGV